MTGALAFTQADASKAKKYGGTGLGLALSKKFCQIARQHLKDRKLKVLHAPGQFLVMPMRLPMWIFVGQHGQADHSFASFAES